VVSIAVFQKKEEEEVMKKKETEILRYFMWKSSKMANEKQQ
jgi:hypothetical protein